MAEEAIEESPEERLAREKRVGWIIIGGWLLLALSGVFLYLSTEALLADQEGSQMKTLTYLTISRLAGIGSFVIGVVAIFNQRWTPGGLLLIGSVILPFVALFVHGTI